MSAACPNFGFSVRIRMRPDVLDEVQLWQAFTRDVIEARGLACGGTRTRDAWSQIIRSEASQATDADRDAVSVWLASRTEIESSNVGPLIDLGNPD